MSNSIFSKEKKIINDIQNVMSTEPVVLENFNMAALLAALLAHYQKLLHQTEMMISATDRRMNSVMQDKKELEQYANELKQFAEKDMLTNILNKATVTQRIRDHIKTEPLSIILFDLDNFKSVNDTYGHPVGDIVLTNIGQLLNDTFRNTGYVGRFGGEEFIIAVADSLDNALDMAEGFRHMVETTPMFDDGATVLSVTVSMGVAPAHVDERFEIAYRRADNVLYTAKRNGRNRVESWDSKEYK